ncbi:uncharacterized protein LOC142588151 [Dermacentor variabilis]|uniref:uncharacterized protein LOC142588151 n=1 Tax=Dermacentor variabilis TaxID=34621 RepID=UPI003F5CA522
MFHSFRFGFPTLQEDVEYGQPLSASTTSRRLTSDKHQKKRGTVREDVLAHLYEGRPTGRAGARVCGMLAITVDTVWGVLEESDVDRGAGDAASAESHVSVGTAPGTSGLREPRQAGRSRRSEPKVDDLLSSVAGNYAESHSRNSTTTFFFSRCLKVLHSRSVLLVDSMYQVPSGQENGKIYHVWQDFGTCTCRNGQQGTFCKHQSMVHSTYGGGFPNAPILKPDKRHKLGVLALTKVSLEASVRCCQSSRPPALLGKHTANMHLSLRTSQYSLTNTAWSAQIPTNVTRRRGRTIKVQPIGIARRRLGVGRGSGRVREGHPSKHQKTKRAHALHLSVKSGVPHAKSHGTRH